MAKQYRSIQFMDDRTDGPWDDHPDADESEDDDDQLLSKSDLSSFGSDDSLSPLPPTIPMRKLSLQDRRRVVVKPLLVKFADDRDGSGSLVHVE